MESSLPSLVRADAAYVTDQLLVGGDLDTLDPRLAEAQLLELVESGVTHVVDTRIEWSDELWVAERAPDVGYLHHGMDDVGQQVPAQWFDDGVRWVVDAMGSGGVVLTHCHMGINRGPSLGFAVLLAQGWKVVAALDAIRAARPIAFVAYAEDALRWHHGADRDALRAARSQLAQWREDNDLDLVEVIRRKRAQGY